MHWFQSFLAGRNGIDATGIAFVIVAVALNFSARITGIGVLSILAVAAMLWALIRMLSRNVTKRREENARFLKLWSGIRESWTDWRSRRAQSDTYKFFTCPGCKNKLRVPKGKGKIQITCPRCGQRFSGKS